jgi:para-nitrobenzyl esterase
MESRSVALSRKLVSTGCDLYVAGLAVFLTMLLAGCGGGTKPLSISIVTPSLADGTIGSPYSVTVQASGGAAPFAWSVSAGALPDNLTLASNSSNTVTISGTPDRVQPAVSFTIRVSDAQSDTATQSYTVNIAGSPTIVVTQSGAIQGTIQGNLLAFRGIPYAAPPTVNLRWRPPQPPASWSGVRNAAAFGNLCPQIDANGNLVGDEDCLVLNIFVGQPPQPQALPVMVFFHGGGNSMGDSQQVPFDLPPLANQGVIVVTVEYRLGLLGFMALSQLSAEDGASSGNYGLMDQIAALTWVQQNIGVFGGDSKHVMLFGQSAGSGDTELLLTSPPAMGLFSVAGMESAAYKSAQLKTLAQAEASDAPAVSVLGCGGVADVLACLRAVPADTIVTNQSSVLSHFNANIDGHVLLTDPLVALKQNGSPVPLLIGSNREEASALGDDPTATPPLDEAGYEAAVHAEFDPFGTGVAANILTLYPASSYAPDPPIYALIAVDSDSLITCRTREVARAATGASRPAVWRYFYVHRFENDATLNLYRAFHRAELFFVFGNLEQGLVANGYTPTAAELTLSSQMMGYWTRFAATGNPNGAGAVQWPTYDPTTDAMLQIDDTQSVINGYHNPQCDYFVNLPAYPPQ